MKTLHELAIEYAKSIYQEEYDDPTFAPDVFQSKNDFAAGYKAAQEWISVNDELPEIKNDGYWFIGKDKDDIHYALYIDSIVEHEEINEIGITHWKHIN